MSLIPYDDLFSSPDFLSNQFATSLKFGLFDDVSSCPDCGGLFLGFDNGEDFRFGVCCGRSFLPKSSIGFIFAFMFVMFSSLFGYFV